MIFLQRYNPLPWTEHWISSKGLQVAPQETEVESYVVGGIKQDLKKDSYCWIQIVIRGALAPLFL